MSRRASSRLHRGWIACLVVSLVFGMLVVSGEGIVAGAGSSGAVAPLQWTSQGALSLALEGWPHAIRFAGADRYETSLATSLGLRGLGDYPFDTPDRSSRGATTLAAANGWWGAGVCPRSIVIVAGSSPSDAMAASALSDPTGNSTEPYLTRSAASDPLFDPVGGLERVDTDFAPVLVTTPASAGATALSTPAHLAAQDLARGGCTLARQAIIVGGPAAVPAGVDAELLSIGYDEVFRVGGSTRYDTAAAVAQSLGTSALPDDAAACPASSDEHTTRMTFVVNAAVEYRSSPRSCQLLSRTVVLADGVTGADALAAGWWTSFWQVPVLFHDGSDVLPPATVAALSTMDIDHIIVLGGVSRISEQVAATAGALAGATVVRVAGEDRYETSVEMAEQLGGWWPTGRGVDFQASMVCLAASSGSGASATGWPDALGAGPFCGALDGAAADPGAPARALAPLTGQAPVLSDVAARRPAHDAVPVLLVPTGATSLPVGVRHLLETAFEPADSWCTSVSAAADCAMPGFAVGFGGSTVLTAEVLAQASSLVSGGSVAPAQPSTPTLQAPFATSLDMSPVFRTSGAGPDGVCVARAGVTDGRWLSVFDDLAAGHAIATNDLMMSGAYVRDADGVARSPGTVAPSCVSFDPPAAGSVIVRAVSLEGRASEWSTFGLDQASSMSMSGPLSALGPTTSSGVASDVDGDHPGTTSRTYVFPVSPVAVVSRGEVGARTGGSLSIELARAGVTGRSDPTTFRATWSLTTDLGTVTGHAEGEAILVDKVWQLRGRSTLTGGSWNLTSGAGGFSGALDTKTAGAAGDDAMSFRVDGVVA